MSHLIRGNLIRTFNRKLSSALYVTGDKAQTNYVVLTPYIDFDEQIQNKAELIKSIEARKLHIDLDKIEKRWNFFKTIDDHREILEITRTEIYNLIAKLKKENFDENRENIEKLQLHVKIIKDDLKNVKEYSYGIEENANLGVLSLPNFLHPSTPISESLIIHQFSEQARKINKNHLEIGKSLNLLEYTNSLFCFLKGEAALFEFALTNYFHDNLKSSFTQFSNADFVKSIVVEGCGTDNLKEVFTLDGFRDDLNRLHIVGGGSLFAFMAYFTKNVIQVSSLPLQLYSLGRKYTPAVENSDLFNSSQSTVIRLFIATKDDAQNMDEIFHTTIKQIIQIYETLGFHFRVVYAAASELDKGEGLKVSIQMFSNFSQKYVEVGNLSIYDNYLSKRLLFTYSINKERKFVKIISGEILNVQTFLACAIENNCLFDKNLLSPVLKKYIK